MPKELVDILLLVVPVAVVAAILLMAKARS